MEESGATGQGDAREEEAKEPDAERSSDSAHPEAERSSESASEEKPEHEARAEAPKHDDSEVDAMGRPKRREVVGQGYGPSKARQLVLYAAAVAVIIGLYLGAQFAVGKLDKAPAHDTVQAPWAQKGASQAPPQRFQ